MTKPPAPDAALALVKESRQRWQKLRDDAAQGVQLADQVLVELDKIIGGAGDAPDAASPPAKPERKVGLVADCVAKLRAAGLGEASEKGARNLLVACGHEFHARTVKAALRELVKAGEMVEDDGVYRAPPPVEPPKARDEAE